MAIKLGCTVWTLMLPDYKAPYEEAIVKVAEAGFDGIELMVNDEKELEEYWTDQKIDEIKALLKEHHLELIQLCMFQNLIGGLASEDKEKKALALDNFRRVCRLAKSLGAGAVNFTSPCPEEDVKVKTTATLPEYYYLNIPDMVLPGGEPRCVEGWRFDAKFRLYFSDSFDWEALWKNFIDSMESIEAIAKEEDIKCNIENRYHTMTPHTDSMLRMFRRLNSEHIGVNFNTAQAFLQREILPWAVHKYGKHLSNLRACDGDGLACYNLPVGAGITYWEGVIEALDEIGYNGYISFEWLNDADKEEHVKESLEYIKKRIQKVVQ